MFFNKHSSLVTPSGTRNHGKNINKKAHNPFPGNPESETGSVFWTPSTGPGFFNHKCYMRLYRFNFHVGESV